MTRDGIPPRRARLVGIACCAALALGTAGCGGDSPKAAASPPPASAPTASPPAGGQGGLLAKQDDPQGGTPLCTTAFYTSTAKGLEVKVRFPGPAMLVISVLQDGRTEPVKQLQERLPDETNSRTFLIPGITTASRVELSVLAPGPTTDTCRAPER